MIESRPSTSSLITPFVPRTLSPSMKKTLSNRIENLIEITHQPDPPNGNTELPLLSPYSYYHRTNTFTSSIRSLIRTRRPDVKEVVQVKKLFSLPDLNSSLFLQLLKNSTLLLRSLQISLTNGNLKAIPIFISVLSD
ncbi:hypothetical protein K1719_040285 [Acacia pycnantha]|nr:hypothetical protein K1719_040285 [Acacia pycnantha]